MKGSTQDTWHPSMTADTTLAKYWLNWRFFLCAIWVVISMIIASILIWKNEKFRCRRSERDLEEDDKEETEAVLYDDESWRPCLQGIHPAWLLVFRICAFTVLLMLLNVAAFVDGPSIFYFYTQWTFTLVTIYFGLGSILSMRGCYLYHKRVGGDRVDNVEVDSEKGNCSTPATIDSSTTSIGKSSLDSNEQSGIRQPAGRLVFIFQIIFQMNAGAVMLTDCVFWFVLVPFLAIKDYRLSALVVSMHSMNAIFLLGDTALNCMRFPLFRIAYFFIWTIVYVLFQWILHASVRLWWPYPFLDLSSSFAPLWYFSVALMHIPCYAIFAFMIKLKHTLFTRWFHDSYQCPR
ncbi:uncharacterized protein [Euphorbia lathyris]|uniref:uncharacterized protein isoform X2 n=1 Tax=Euphorbia lathyris TaxID=212925 RepID=UPI003313B480